MTPIRRNSKRYQTNMLSLDSSIAEAIAFMREHEPADGYYLGFSGGKDSICLHELARLSGVKFDAYYSATGIDPPEVVKFIKANYPEVKWIRPSISFWDAIVKKSPPLRYQRWCCDVLKKDPSKHIRQIRLMGIRAEESASRKKIGRIDFNKHLKQTTLKPIFYWKEWHVWEFIEQQNLKYPSLYDEGFDRIGCVVCPFIFHKNGRKYSIHKNKWPGMFKTFEHACKRWWLTKKTIDEKYANFEEWMAAYYRDYK